VALGEKFVAKVAAEETGPAGDEDAHGQDVGESPGAIQQNLRLAQRRLISGVRCGG
jgi:hypothetical protein